MILHVTKATYTTGYRLLLSFNDDSAGEVDLSGELDGPVFEPLHDPDYFKSFKLEGNTVAWDNGADFAPEFLHSLLPSESKRTVSTS